jgi:ubiquitin-protein ligase
MCIDACGDMFLFISLNRSTFSLQYLRCSSDTIYVRVYEERMDLLRAVILGAPGTPYHDGLFVFDLFLPPEYPHTPPVRST